jgi:hypothetical protein
VFISAFCAAENPQKIDLHQCYRLIVRAACAHGRLMRQHLLQPKNEQAASYRQTCPGYYVFVFGIIHKQDQHEHAIAEQLNNTSHHPHPFPPPACSFMLPYLVSLCNICHDDE